MATILSGGVITKESGSQITYRLKCDKCGTVEHSESQVTVSKGSTSTYTRKCMKCGNQQKVIIKG